MVSIDYRRLGQAIVREELLHMYNGPAVLRRSFAKRIEVLEGRILQTEKDVHKEQLKTAVTEAIISRIETEFTLSCLYCRSLSGCSKAVEEELNLCSDFFLDVSSITSSVNNHKRAVAVLCERYGIDESYLIRKIDTIVGNFKAQVEKLSVNSFRGL